MWTAWNTWMKLELHILIVIESAAGFTYTCDDFLLKTKNSLYVHSILPGLCKIQLEERKCCYKLEAYMSVVSWWLHTTRPGQASHPVTLARGNTGGPIEVDMQRTRAIFIRLVIDFHIEKKQCASLEFSIITQLNLILKKTSPIWINIIKDKSKTAQALLK